MEKKSSGKKKAAPSKMDAPKPAKVFASYKALMTSKSKGTLPRGLKVKAEFGMIKWEARGTIIFEMSVYDYAKARATSDGFKIAD